MSAVDREQLPKRTGLTLIAHVTITRLLTLIALNLVFCLTALPLVTLPNAIAALYRCIGLVLREEEFPLFRTYIKAFQSEFLKTLAAGWVVLILLFGAIVCAVFYWSIHADAAILFAMMCAVLAIYLYAVCCNLFYMLSRMRLSLGPLLKNAFLLVFLQPIKKTAICLISLLVLGLCAWWFPRTLPVVVLIGFSLAALTACYGVRDKIEQSVIS